MLVTWQARVALCGVLVFCEGGRAWAGLIAEGHHFAETEEVQALATECAPLLAHEGAWHALQTAKVLLQSQGMYLHPQACPFVRTGEGQLQQVLDVRVRVADSDIASRFVRGPLADGEEVDMGGVSLIFSSDVHDAHYAGQEDASPDVQFNRHWLSHLMQSRGWQAVAGYWWAFVPQAAPAAQPRRQRVQHKLH